MFDQWGTSAYGLKGPAHLLRAELLGPGEDSAQQLDEPHPFHLVRPPPAEGGVHGDPALTSLPRYAGTGRPRVPGCHRRGIFLQTESLRQPCAEQVSPSPSVSCICSLCACITFRYSLQYLKLFHYPCVFHDICDQLSSMLLLPKDYEITEGSEER